MACQKETSVSVLNRLCRRLAVECMYTNDKGQGASGTTNLGLRSGPIQGGYRVDLQGAPTEWTYRVGLQGEPTE